METMPIKSQSFGSSTIAQAIVDLESYSNGDNATSEQFTQCGSVITRDHYVYNAFDCQFQLINISNSS